jgi:intracellular septation protein
MKFLFDLIPVILFFGTFKWGESHRETAHAFVSQYLTGLISGGAAQAAQAPMILATVVGIIATVLQISYLLVRKQKVDGMLWLALAIIVLFGGATIYFHDPIFILWKPTILYWLSGVALLVAFVVFNKNWIRKGMQEQISLPEAVWTRLLYVWVAFFGVLGLLNLFVAFVVFKDNTSAWVSFKLFGFTGIFVLFIVGQTLMLSKYIQDDKA